MDLSDQPDTGPGAPLDKSPESDTVAPGNQPDPDTVTGSNVTNQKDDVTEATTGITRGSETTGISDVTETSASTDAVTTLMDYEDQDTLGEDNSAGCDTPTAASLQGSATPVISSGHNGTDGADTDSDDVIILDSDSDDDVYANPEPSKELLSADLMNAGNIGDTVISKHWLFSTLMELIKVVDEEENKKQPTPESADLGLDLPDSLQDELCKLWDMSTNEAVVTFLLEFKSIELLTGVIAKSKAPRAIEICVGILGNMACSEVACRNISINDRLRMLVLLLLESPDAPTLVETTRLLYTCMSASAVYDVWMTSVRDTPSVLTNLTFILKSSTNVELLAHTADLLDKILDTEDDLLMDWSNPDLVGAILEAVQQTLSKKDTLDTFLHILQLITTCDKGIEAVGVYSESLCEFTTQYLIRKCEEDILILDTAPHLNVLGCVLCVLSTAFSSLGDKARLIVCDFQLMRCLLKILQVVYPKVRKFTPEPNRTNSRSDSISETNRPPSTSEENKEKEKEEAKPEEKTIEPAKKPDPKDDEDTKDSISSSTAESESTCEMLYEVIQNLLTDLVLILTEEGEEKTEEPSGPTNPPETLEEDTPYVTKTLKYLDSHCERQRLRMLVYTLDEVLQDTEVMDCCSRLKTTAHKYNYCRLERIIEEYSVG